MNTSFTIEGFWWLPNNPELKIPGHFSYTPGDTSRLKLLGVLNKTEDDSFPLRDFINPEFIHGISRKGESITLHKCLQIGLNNTIGDAGRVDTSEFMAHFAFFGAYFSDSSEIQFSSITLLLHNLDNWYNKGSININHSETGFDEIKAIPQPPIVINLNELELKINVSANHSFNLNSATILMRVSLQLISLEQKTFDEFLSVVRLLQDFFSFVISAPTFVIEMTGSLRNNNKFGDSSMGARAIKIYYNSPGWQPNAREFFWSDMLLPYTKVEDCLAEILRLWVQRTETIGPVYNLFFAGIYRSTYPENEFLNLCQAIETYQRRIHGGEYMSKERYLNGLYKALIAAITEDISKDFRTSLVEGKLRYANEFSLRKRIIILCEHIAQNLSLNILHDKNDISAFAKKISDTRNYLTHYSPELKGKAITGGSELFEINNQLKLFISICFLEQMGISSKKIASLLSRHLPYMKYFITHQDSKNQD